MHAIILSKDRPAQLHLCLDAINKNGNGVFDTVSVLFFGSNHDFLAGYGLVSSVYTNVEWLFQEHYKEDILHLLSNNYSQLTTFFTDDDILYRPIPENKLYFFNLFNEMDNVACFSLRLGLNTVVQDPYTGMPTTPPSTGFAESDGKVFWPWKEVPPWMNFGYPLAVDGHILRTDDWINIHSDLSFNNPNQQEVAIQIKLPTLPPIMGCFKQSVVVNTPLNRVQETCTNRAGETFGCSAEEMNKRYLNGEKLDLDSIDFSNIVGCHQELDIKWTTK